MNRNSTRKRRPLFTKGIALSLRAWPLHLYSDMDTLCWWLISWLLGWVMALQWRGSINMQDFSSHLRIEPGTFGYIQNRRVNHFATTPVAAGRRIKSYPFHPLLCVGPVAVLYKPKFPGSILGRGYNLRCIFNDYNVFIYNVFINLPCLSYYIQYSSWMC